MTLKGKPPIGVLDLIVFEKLTIFTYTLCGIKLIFASWHIPLYPLKWI